MARPPEVQDVAFVIAVLASWATAFFEYWPAVFANRMGAAVDTAAKLKSMQEVIALLVFAFFSVLYLKEPIGWKHAVGSRSSQGVRPSSFMSGREKRIG